MKHRARLNVLLLKIVPALSLSMLLIVALSCSENQPSEVDELWLSFAVLADTGLETRLQVVQDGGYLILRASAEPQIARTLSAAQRTRLEALLVPERLAIYTNDSLFRGIGDTTTPACVPDGKSAKAYVLVIQPTPIFCWLSAGMLSPETLELIAELEGIIASHSG